MTSIIQQLDNFYLTDEQLENSPSRRWGIDAETEKRLRIYGCDRIQRAVILLKLPQVVAATAQILLHRFYCKRDLSVWHIRKLSVAVTWIAVKIEEQSPLLQLSDLVLVFNVLQQREDGHQSVYLENPESDKFKEVQAEIAAKYEMGVFKALGFICHVDHPHKILANLLGLVFFNNETLETNVPDGLVQVAWNLANDSLRTTLCVRYRSVTIACACIYLASRRLRVPMPEDPPWWDIGSTRLGDIEAVCLEIVDLAKYPRPVYISVNKGKTAAALDKARNAAVQPSPVPAESAVAEGGGAASGGEEQPAAAAPAGFAGGTTAGGDKRRRGDGEGHEGEDQGHKARRRDAPPPDGPGGRATAPGASSDREAPHPREERREHGGAGDRKRGRVDSRERRAGHKHAAQDKHERRRPRERERGSREGAPVHEPPARSSAPQDRRADAPPPGGRAGVPSYEHAGTVRARPSAPEQGAAGQGGAVRAQGRTADPLEQLRAMVHRRPRPGGSKE